MTTLQLRLDKNQDLARMVNDVVERFHSVLLAHRDCCAFWPPDRSRVERIVRQSLENAIQGYRCCGKQEQCHRSLTVRLLRYPLWRLAPIAGRPTYQDEHQKVFFVSHGGVLRPVSPRI